MSIDKQSDKQSSRPGTAVRPGTASRPDSRQAWSEPGQLYGKDLDKAKNDAVGGDFKIEKNGDLKAITGVEDEDVAQSGCLYKFKKIVCCGAVADPEASEEVSKEVKIKTTLRELIIYIIFLVDLCILTFGMTSSSMYYYNKVMSELFLDSTAVGFTKTFRGMTTMEDFWSFAEGPLVQGLYWEKWYDGRNVSDEHHGFIFYENKLLGVPRLRQLRVRPDSCVVPDAFEREIKECFDAYDDTAEDTADFGLGDRNGTAWHYASEKELDGSSYWGQISSYSGGGFVQELAANEEDTMGILGKLKSDRWLDRATRAVFVDFTVYNANINLFCMVKLVLEFPATGGVIPSWSIRTVKLLRYVSVMDYMVLGCEGIFVAFLVYYLAEEISDIRDLKCTYFANGWNILDDLMILIGICSVAFSVFRQKMVDDKLTGLLENSNQYANFEFLSFAQSRFNDAVAILVFFSWIKIFKYISFNKTMNQLSSTLSRCAKDVGGFAVMFFIFFFAYAQLGYLIFGTQIKDFSTFYDAVFTLLRTILGDFNFHELEQANRVLGPIFFITYVFFVFFVLLNMFLAIINDTYAEVKAELASQKNEFELADYFRRGYQNMMRKMNLRKDRITDIQQALADADTNDDSQIDFDEWRTQLKQKGYAEQEIEELFNKYDTDGDRVIDAKEIKKLNAILEGEKGILDSEIDNMSERPQTSKSFDRFSDFENPSVASVGGRRARQGRLGVEEHNVISRRVDRMEQNMGEMIAKVDNILVKIEGMERVKMNHCAKMAKIMDEAKNSTSDEPVKTDHLLREITNEIERFDKDDGVADCEM